MRFLHRGLSPAHRGLTKLRPKGSKFPGVDWNGKIRLAPENLEQPLRWRKPRRVFVDSLADLFHPKVPLAYIAAVLGVMAATPWHTYLVLTKRDPRPFYAFVEANARESRYANTSWPEGYFLMDAALNLFRREGLEDGRIGGPGAWPLPNVHLGRSVSDQATFDADVPELLECRAAVHWLSIEPLLGPIDMGKPYFRGATPLEEVVGIGDFHRRRIVWVVVGGESGAAARPCDVEWIRSLVRQCSEAEIACFVKQLGARAMMRADSLLARVAGDHPETEWPVGTRFTTAPGHMGTPWQGRWVPLGAKGGDMNEWPADLRVREYPTTTKEANA
jgi:protein gp37